MPEKQLKNLAKQAGISDKKSKEYWEKSKEIASEMGKSGDYDYIMGIWKNMVGLKEEVQEKKIERYKSLFEMVSTNIAVTPENAGKVIDKYSKIQDVVDDLEEINKKNSIEDNILK